MLQQTFEEIVLSTTLVCLACRTRGTLFAWRLVIFAARGVTLIITGLCVVVICAGPIILVVVSCKLSVIRCAGERLLQAANKARKPSTRMCVPTLPPMQPAEALEHASHPSSSCHRATV